MLGINERANMKNHKHTRGSKLHVLPTVYLFHSKEKTEHETRNMIKKTKHTVHDNRQHDHVVQRNT